MFELFEIPGPKKPKKPGALRAPDCFIFLFLLLFDPKYPRFFPGALRVPDGFIFLRFPKLLGPAQDHWPGLASSGRALASPDKGGGL